jgi:hypothetical protein
MPEREESEDGLRPASVGVPGAWGGQRDHATLLKLRHHEGSYGGSVPCPLDQAPSGGSPHTFLPLLTAIALAVSAFSRSLLSFHYNPFERQGACILLLSHYPQPHNPTAASPKQADTQYSRRWTVNSQPLCTARPSLLLPGALLSLSGALLSLSLRPHSGKESSWSIVAALSSAPFLSHHAQCLQQHASRTADRHRTVAPRRWLHDFAPEADLTIALTPAYAKPRPSIHSACTTASPPPPLHK